MLNQLPSKIQELSQVCLELERIKINTEVEIEKAWINQKIRFCELGNRNDHNREFDLARHIRLVPPIQ